MGLASPDSNAAAPAVDAWTAASPPPPHIGYVVGPATTQQGCNKLAAAQEQQVVQPQQQLNAQVGVPEAAKDLALTGLRNEAGEYNCFLNVIIQCLWRCTEFRQQVRFCNRQEGEHGESHHAYVALVQPLPAFLQVPEGVACCALPSPRLLTGAGLGQGCYCQELGGSLSAQPLSGSPPGTATSAGRRGRQRPCGRRSH